MERRRFMIVWLLVFGLVGVLSERIKSTNAAGKAVVKSVPLKKAVGSRNIDIDTRKNVPHHDQRERQQERNQDRQRDRARQQLERNMAELARDRGQRERGRGQGRDRSRSPPRRPASVRSS